jgi:hypothetical protein
MIKHRYRVTKYNPGYRDRWGAYAHDEWTNRRDIGRDIDGHVLTEDEYLSTENRYLYVLTAFAQEAGVQRLTVVGLDKPPATPPQWQHLEEGTTVSLDEAVEIARIMLREGPLGARLEDGDRFYVHIDDDLYMFIGTEIEPTFAISEAERLGLFVEPDVASPLQPDPAERYWWLDDGMPVRHQLVAYDRQDGHPLGRWDIPDAKVPDLRALYPPKPGDDNFYDAYEVDDLRRTAVGQVLGWELDPNVEYLLETYTRR